MEARAPIPIFGNIGNTDQRSKIDTFNIAPTYTRVISNNLVFNFGAYVRKDRLQLLSEQQPTGRSRTPICKLSPSPNTAR